MCITNGQTDRQTEGQAHLQTRQLTGIDTHNERTDRKADYRPTLAADERICDNTETEEGLVWGKGGVGWREKRTGNGEREKETDRQSDRQRQRHRDIDRETETDRGRGRERETETKTGRDRDKDRETQRQREGRKKDRQTSRLRGW